MLRFVERLGIVVEEGRIGGLDGAIVNIWRIYLGQVHKVTIGSIAKWTLVWSNALVDCISGSGLHPALLGRRQSGFWLLSTVETESQLTEVWPLTSDQKMTEESWLMMNTYCGMWLETVNWRRKLLQGNSASSPSTLLIRCLDSTFRT
jgi:hypothetical protein